ncbi:MAG: cell division topological specificity factor MinE [Oceanobacter sp.]|jgi:cell division topological specificity factor
MSLMDIFRKESTSSASVAKERLRVLVAHDRLQTNGPDYLPQLEQEIMAVIRKYVPVQEDDITVQLENQGKTSILELNVTLPGAR